MILILIEQKIAAKPTERKSIKVEHLEHVFLLQKTNIDIFIFILLQFVLLVNQIIYAQAFDLQNGLQFVFLFFLLIRISIGDRHIRTFLVLTLIT